MGTSFGLGLFYYMQLAIGYKNSYFHHNHTAYTRNWLADWEYFDYQKNCIRQVADLLYFLTVLIIWCKIQLLLIIGHVFIFPERKSKRIGWKHWYWLNYYLHNYSHHYTHNLREKINTDFLQRHNYFYYILFIKKNQLILLQLYK